MLFRLLSLPVTGPLDAVTWVGGRLRDAAEARLFNPEAIREEMAALEARLESGALSEADFEEAEAVLIERLREAGARMRAKER